ncbi:MAG: DUF4089 domain-containing protein [Cyanobacteria bacterium J06592_8]
MNNIPKYIDQTAELIDLKIAPEYREGVISNLEQIAKLAKLVNEFPLTDEIEIAPIFNPSFHIENSSNS